MGGVASEVGVGPQSLQGMELLKGAGVVQEEKGEGLPGEGDLGRSCLGFGSPARCRPSRPVQPPPAPAPGFVVLRLPPPPPPPLRDPARAVAAATGTRPHNAFLFAPPPAHTALRHAAEGGRAGERPKTYPWLRVGIPKSSQGFPGVDRRSS